MDAVGADLGAEKFIDIKCRIAGIKPAAVVIVATVRALKMHGGVKKEDLKKEDLKALAAGMANLQRHVENIKEFGLPAVKARAAGTGVLMAYEKTGYDTKGGAEGVGSATTSAVVLGSLAILIADFFLTKVLF